jgi:hypothetical protein
MQVQIAWQRTTRHVATLELPDGTDPLKVLSHRLIEMGETSPSQIQTFNSFTDQHITALGVVLEDGTVEPL